MIQFLMLCTFPDATQGVKVADSVKDVERQRLMLEDAWKSAGPVKIDTFVLDPARVEKGFFLRPLADWKRSVAPCLDR